MPALAHEALVELFRNRPVLAVELLRVTGEVTLDADAARVGSIDLSQATPPEFRCDALIEVYEHARPATDGASSPSAAIIVEVQRSKDDAKRRSWPVYVTVAAQRLRCPVYLLVIATTREVGRWAARAIELGQPGFRLSPIVLDFDHIPRVTEREVARNAPELAVLSALAHQDAETAEAALLGMAALPDDQQRLYWDLILAALPDTARHVLEAMMLKNYEYQSDFARKYYSEGREEGREQGREEGREQGREQGRSDERRAIVRELLIVKFGPLSPEIDERLAAASYAELGELGKRLLVADSLDALFAPT